MDDNKPDDLLPVEQKAEEKGEEEKEGEVKEVGKEKDEKEAEVEIGKEEDEKEAEVEIEKEEDEKEAEVEIEKEEDEKEAEVEIEKEEDEKEAEVEIGKEEDEKEAEVEIGKEEDEKEAEVEIGKEEEAEEEVEEVEEEKQGMSAAEATKDRPNSSGDEEDEQRLPVEEAEVQVKEFPPMSGTPPREQRAKKAQRTKRANVSSTQNATKANPKSAKQKVTSTATSNDQAGDGSEEEEEELEEGGGGGGDEVTKVIQGIVHTMERVFRLILCCCGFICRLLVGIFGAVRRGLGVLFGAAMFAGVAYVIGTYVMTPVSEYEVMGFEARLKFLLRYQVWPTLPVFLAAVAGMVRRDNEVHRTYGRECFEQALMSLFNLLLLATHLQPSSCLLWTGACVITATGFSLLHWFCLVYTKRRGSVFSLPGYLLNFGVMAYNLYVIFGQNLGYVPMSTEPEVHMTTGSQGGAISYWNHVTMCHLVEQMFCKP